MELADGRPGFVDTAFGPTLLATAAVSLTPTAVCDLLLTGGYPPTVEPTTEDRSHTSFSSYVTAILAVLQELA